MIFFVSTPTCDIVAKEIYAVLHDEEPHCSMNHLKKQQTRRRSFTVRPIRIFLILLAFLPVTLILEAKSVPAGEQITIGLVPEMNIFAQMQRFQPLAEYLSRETGLDVQLTMLSRYTNVLERLRSGEIDAAFLGSFTGAMAIRQLKAVPLARPVNLDNTSTYHGIIFARKDSGIRGVEDMRGKIMAFVEPTTTAGYIFPLAWFKQQGIADYKALLKDYYFAGSHDAAIDAVVEDKADIGAAKNTIYNLYLANSSEARKNLIVIARSQPVPSNGLCVMPSVSSPDRAKLQTALFALDQNPQGKIVLQHLHALKFVKTEPADYQPVLDMAAEAGIALAAYFNQESR